VRLRAGVHLPIRVTYQSVDVSKFFRRISSYQFEKPQKIFAVFGSYQFGMSKIGVELESRERH
jgi:hypothetical protein